MSPLRLRWATVGLAHDLTSSKGLRTGSGTQVFRVNTQCEFCCPIATSYDIPGPYVECAAISRLVQASAVFSCGQVS